jgi:hypothetical protein
MVMREIPNKIAKNRDLLESREYGIFNRSFAWRLFHPFPEEKRIRVRKRYFFDRAETQSFHYLTQVKFLPGSIGHL